MNIMQENCFQKKKQRLNILLENPNENKYEIQLLSNEIETLKTLFENYNLGMNVFRRAQGGRSGLREQQIAL